MADTCHPAILVCQMQGGSTGICIDSIYKVIPDLKKPKTHSVIYIEGADDGLLVEGLSSDLIKKWSDQLFYRDAIDAGYFDADDEEIPEAGEN